MIHKDQVNIVQYLCKGFAKSVYFSILNSLLAFAIKVFPFIPLTVLCRKDPLWFSIVILMTLPGERSTVLWTCLNSVRSSLIVS